MFTYFFFNICSHMDGPKRGSYYVRSVRQRQTRSPFEKA